MLLTGTYRRALDDKLRLAIPKPLRDQLPADLPLYLTPGLDGCLAIYPQAAFAAIADRLAATSPAAREVRDYSRLFFSQAAIATPDSQWRVRIPAELIEWSKLDGEAVVVGVRDHVEVWAADRWDEYVARRDGQYEQLAEAAFLFPASSPPRPAESTTTDTLQEGGRNPPR